MGEIADMMIEGFIDSETGEVIDGDAPGYPRTKRLKKSLTGPTCDQCGKRLRTKQALADHLRDKHQGAVGRKQ